MARLVKRTAGAVKKKKNNRAGKSRHDTVTFGRCRKGKKLNRCSLERMRCAMEEFHKGVLGLRRIARAWDVPKSTLQRRLKGVVAGSLHASGRKTYLTDSEEKDLAATLKLMASRGFRLSGTQVRKIAFEYAQKKGVNKFSREKGSAGYFWLRGFLNRHHLSFRTPEALSVGHANGMWFDKYERLLEELYVKDLPSHLWNCDETGLQEHFVKGRVISETGEPCYQITKSEKGETTTVLACFNACGTYCPPTVIFKGKRLTAAWVVG